MDYYTYFSTEYLSEELKKMKDKEEDGKSDKDEDDHNKQ
jgi:hypothetical protein